MQLLCSVIVFVVVYVVVGCYLSQAVQPTGGCDVVEVTRYRLRCTDLARFRACLVAILYCCTYAAIHVAFTCDNAFHTSVYVPAVICLLRGDAAFTSLDLFPTSLSQEQKRAIVAYAEMELTKKIETESVPKVTNADLEFLFEAYDTENIGFVDVALIKERVRTFYLSEQTLFHFMDSISDLADDEMVSVVEFKRLFRLYATTKDRNGVATAEAK
jgi:hypothetical protein